MRVSISSKGDFKNVIKWLGKMTQTTPTESMHEIGRSGVKSLASHTPVDTGETAAGWDYKITGKLRTSEIEWFNSAHPDAKVNVAKLIELGHGTGNGGFVPPQPYIQKAMDGVFRQAGDKIAKGMTK